MTDCPHTCCDGPCPGHRLDPVDCLACALIEVGIAPYDARAARAAIRDRLEGSSHG